jgi:hypothetical protein
MIKNLTTIMAALVCMALFNRLSAQEKFTRVEIVTDTTETTRKLLSQMDNQTFYKWVRSVELNAELKQFDFKAPPLAQFNDNFNLKVNISDFNDTVNISLQLLRKSVADNSKVLAKISFASSTPLDPDKNTQDSMIVSSHHKRDYTDSLWWEFDKSRKRGRFTHSAQNEGINFKLGDQGNDDTTVRPMPKGGIKFKLADRGNDDTTVRPMPKGGIKFKLADQGNDDTTVRPMPKGGIKFNVAQPAINRISSVINFNIGLLQMQNFAGPVTTVMRYNEMPELNNAKTLNIGFDGMWGLNLYKGNVRLWCGISYDFYNYRFQNNAIRIDPNQADFKYRFADANDPNELNPEKSKLVSEYIGIPLAISFENSKWNASKVRLMIGVKGGYLMNAYTKVKYYDDRVTKNYDDFHLNELVVHPFFRFQWNHWSLYGKYSITPLTRNQDKNAIDPIISGQKNMVLGISMVID